MNSYSRSYLFLSLAFSIGIVFAKCATKSLTNQPHNNITVHEKQKGAHVFGRFDSLSLQPLIDHNFDWITLVPFAGQDAHNSSEVRHHRKNRSSIEDSNQRWINQIQTAHSAGLKVFLKPHIWLHTDVNDKWRSDIFPSDDESWEQWSMTYREFIMRYALIAEQTQVDMYCIGTELTRLTIEKPEFWKQLIQDVRKIYSGKITYAANWYQEFERISFWNELDFIGVQAYFPLAKNDKPSVAQISKGWDKYLNDLASVSSASNRPILFTEIGYKSTPDAARTPWEWIDYSAENEKEVCFITQTNCYKAFFDSVWEKDWFAGAHIWQWRSDFEKGRGKSELDFTPQGKPASKIIAEHFDQRD